MTCNCGMKNETEPNDHDRLCPEFAEYANTCPICHVNLAYQMPNTDFIRWCQPCFYKVADHLPNRNCKICKGAGQFEGYAYKTGEVDGRGWIDCNCSFWDVM